METWLLLCLYGTLVLALALVLSFYYATIRYFVEAFPVLAVLTSLGFWQGYRLLAARPLARIAYSVLAVLLVAFSISVALLLPFADPLLRFQKENAAFCASLAHFLSPWVRALLSLRRLGR